MAQATTIKKFDFPLENPFLSYSPITNDEEVRSCTCVCVMCPLESILEVFESWFWESERERGVVSLLPSLSVAEQPVGDWKWNPQNIKSHNGAFITSPKGWLGTLMTSCIIGLLCVCFFTWISFVDQPPSTLIEIGLIRLSPINSAGPIELGLVS